MSTFGCISWSSPGCRAWGKSLYYTILLGSAEVWEKKKKSQRGKKGEQT